MRQQSLGRPGMAVADGKQQRGKAALGFRFDTGAEFDEHFGGTSAKTDPDKLADWPWTPGPDGAPIIDDCDWFAGRVLDQFDTGDHVAFVLAPFGGEYHEAEQLGYQDASTIDAGQPAG